jgi:hypothetical protein
MYLLRGFGTSGSQICISGMGGVIFAFARPRSRLLCNTRYDVLRHDTMFNCDTLEDTNRSTRSYGCVQNMDNRMTFRPRANGLSYRSSQRIPGHWPPLAN